MCVLWWCWLILLALCFQPVLAQNSIGSKSQGCYPKTIPQVSSPQLSPAAIQAIYKSKLLPENSLTVILQTNAQFKTAFLPPNLKINRHIGKVVTAQIPANELAALKFIQGIEYITVANPLFTKTLPERRETRADVVHQGLGFEKPFKGKGVIVGVIDNGFDYTHPAFQNDSGNLRIISVWEQNFGGGTPPQGFTYGRELVSEAEIRAAGADINRNSHGTQCAGIAAGGSYLNSGAMTGIAPESELILVSSNLTDAGIIDACGYIFRKAESAGKPCVINISLGSHLGPHDGKSLVCSVFDELVNGAAGRAVVMAAGNEGNLPLFIQHHFSDSIPTGVFTRVGFEPQPTGLTIGKIDLWADTGSQFAVRVHLTDTAGFSLAASRYFYTQTDTLQDTLLVVGSDSLAVLLSGVSRSILNNKPNILVNLARSGPQDSVLVALEIVGARTRVQAWNNGAGNGAVFSNRYVNHIISNWLKGSTDYTITNEASGEAAIAVGAYTYTTKYTDVVGNRQQIQQAGISGDLAAFSSKGPNADGRSKPEITAPGNEIPMPYSSFDSLPIERRVNPIIRNSRMYGYGMGAGTSFAAAIATGAVALMFEAAPALTNAELQRILVTTARRDGFTGTIFEKSNLWGGGKLDIAAAVSGAVKFAAHTASAAAGPVALRLWPNPGTDDRISVMLPAAGNLRMFNAQGQLLREVAVNAGIETISLATLNSGIYYIQFVAYRPAAPAMNATLIYLGK
jgi:subtilisin family serine protease